jgi:two-component sensor histidine kinase
VFKTLFLSILTLCTLSAAQAQENLLTDYARAQQKGIPLEQQDSFFLAQARYYYAFYTRESYRKAMECYLEALRLAIQYKHTDNISQCYFGIGSIYDANNNLQQSIRYYQMYYEGVLRKRPFDPVNVLRATFNIAATYAKARDTANAYHYNLKMAQMLGWVKDSVRQSEYRLLIAHTFSVIGKDEEFAQYFAPIKDRTTFRDGELAYGRLYAEARSKYALQTGKRDEAIRPILQELAHTKDSIPLLNLLHRTYALLGNYKEAYECELLLVSADMRSMDKTTYGDINYRLLEADNLLQQRENMQLQLNEQTLHLKSSFLYVFSALLIAGLLASLFFYRRFRIRSRHTAEQNKLIRTHDETNTLLLKEIHHRVKNNLQIISSMAELQLNKPENDLYLSMREIQSKMRTMAIAHQMMYEGNEMNDVDMQAYFERMADMTMELLAVSGNPVQHSIRMHGNKLDLEKLVTLALAVNEMLINSIKHVLPCAGNCYIDMECRLIEGEFHFTYSDNGPDLPDSNIETITGTGIRLIHKLARQLDAKIRVDKDPSGKIEYLIIFSKTTGNL